MTILALAGSPSTISRSSALLRHATSLLAARGYGISELGLRDIPADDLIEGRYAGTAAAALRARVSLAQAVLIATPVYKASFSGGLKALLDLLDEKSLAGKVVLPIATGGSPAHLLALDYSLKPVLSALGARHILGGIFATDQQVRIGDDGAVLIDEDVELRLRAAVDLLSREVTQPPSPRTGYDIGRLLAQARLSV
jgi:FMN reductase